jgi:hypothetical protein
VAERRSRVWARARVVAIAVPAAFAMVSTLTPGASYGFHGGPEIFPAYYENTVVSLMMGPSGNSSNPNQVFGGFNCFGLGPDMANTSRRSDVPIMYTLFVPGATQMSCPDGTLRHDMVLTAVPGDPGYQPAVRIVRCTPGVNWANAAIGPAFPYTSAVEVQAAIAAGKLTCAAPSPIRMAPVVGRPTGGM